MSNPLELVTGPKCRNCGCADSELVSTTTRWGQEVQKRECASCGVRWSVVIGKPKATKRKTSRPDPVASFLRLLRNAGEKPDGRI